MAGSTSEDVMPPMIYTMSKDWCSSQKKPSFAWFFDRKLPGDGNGAWHSSDLWYWFGTLENCWRPMEKKDFELSRQMAGYLCSFAASGTPAGNGYPVWKTASAGSMLLGEKPTHMGKPSTAKMIATMLTNKAVGE
jgi:para-nitrobenzyl esterase